MDVSSRCILTCVAIQSNFGKKPTSENMLYMLDNAINETNKPEILHADLGSEFNNNLIKKYCKLESIKQSFTGNDISGFGNQFIESLNNKFKTHYLNKCADISTSIKDLLFNFCLLHNTSQHTGNLYPHSPIVTYFSLLDSDMGTISISDIIDKKLSNKAISVIKQEKTTSFVANNLLITPELLEKRVLTNVSDGEIAIMSMVTKATSELSSALEDIKRQNVELLKKNETQQSKIDFLVSEQELKSKEQLDRLEKKRLFKCRKRQKERDTISFSEFQQSLTLISQSKTMRLQVSLQLGICLMYFFGIRISNCLTLTNAFYSDLLSSYSSIDIPQIKTGLDLTMLKPDKAILKQYFEPPIAFLMDLKGSDSNIILIDYYRSYWNGEVNYILKQLPGNILSHSFRINMVTKA